MSNTVISVDSISKQYRLGSIGTGSISHDVNRWWHRVRGKEDPYLKIGEENDRTTQGNSDYVWALRDISFEVRQGDVLGIIGRNGAGKSTLLKILSRTTVPTTGSIKAKGRIASLLEVGTGFHPELSGRENIFLNGAILGMRKNEIRNKFDEIVDFSGVERYIDTPVKRYSSGMYVRLAFAVAAHLDPEILVVDEVLAVGDAEFQKKCLGKMKDVSASQGRTILFVSHNMTAMNSLCNSAIYLKNGKIERTGDTSTVINYYLSTGSEVKTQRRWAGSNCPGDDVVRLLELRLINSQKEYISVIDFYSESGVEFTYQIIKPGYCPIPNLHLFDDNGDHIFVSAESTKNISGEPGIYKTIMWIPGHLLNTGRYSAGVAASTMVPERIHYFEQQALEFDVIENMNRRQTDYRGSIPGVIRPELHWVTEKIS